VPVRAALETASHVDQRRRALTGEVTAVTVLNLCLYSGEGYDSVLKHTFGALPGALAPGGRVPTGPALSQARVRLGDEPVRVLFEHTARTGPGTASWKFPQVKDSKVFGLEVSATDGTTLDLPWEGTVGTEFATPSGGKHPQAQRGSRARSGAGRGPSPFFLGEVCREALLQPGVAELVDGAGPAEHPAVVGVVEKGHEPPGQFPAQC
jgi:Insertion element 4 transposase N-terminal